MSCSFVLNNLHPSLKRFVLERIGRYKPDMSSGLELKQPTGLPDLKGLDSEARVEAMVEWFHENFEDPSQHMPYDGREGGFQYIWGGPYDALEELSEGFPGATEEEIQAAVDEVTADGTFEWAPSDHRVQPDDLDDPFEENEVALRERLNALRGQLDELETAFEQLAYQTHLMGHNRPPEDMRIGLDERDFAEAKESIADIRVELARTDPLVEGDPAALERAEGRLRQLSAKIRTWVLTAGKWIGTGVGAAIGKELWDDPVALYQKIDAIVGTLGAWVQHLGLPF